MEMKKMKLHLPSNAMHRPEVEGADNLSCCVLCTFD